jgi:hypothetical protein
MKVGEPLTSGRSGDEGKDIHLRIPKHFRNMREHAGEVFMGDGQLLCSCHTSAPLASSGRLGLGRNLCFIHRARHSTLDRIRDHLENGFRRHQTD